MSEARQAVSTPVPKTLRPNATSVPFWRQLRWNLIFYFVLLATLPVLSVTYVILSRTGAQATNQVYDQLDSVAELKQDQISRWLNEGKLVMDTFLSDLNQNRLAAFAESKPLDAREQADVNELLVEATSSRYFTKMFIYDTGGRVIASSDPTDIGKDVANQLYFEVSLYANYIQPPLAEPATGQMVMYMTRPLRIGKSDAKGVLAGQFGIDTLAEIMTKRTGLGESGETYLVSLENNYLWTPSRFPGYEMTRAYHSQGIDSALGGIRGRSAYDNYRTPPVPVFGSYRFVPEMRAGLLAEVEQSQAVSPYRQAQLLGIATAVVATLIAIVTGFLVAQQISRPVTALTGTASCIAGGDLSIRSTIKSRSEIGTLASAFNAMTDQLQEMIGTLEQRVAERTAALARRTGYLEATAAVSKDVTSELDMRVLLTKVVNEISQRFGIYHTGIFLLDATGTWAELQAASSAGGQRMLARGHRLQVGHQGMVGYVSSTGQARIALDVGADATYFDNPDLAETRSEMALPLRARGEIIGVLDVQSTEPQAFVQEDTAVLQTLADQVAMAISNARLFQQAQASLEAEHRAYGELSRQAWQQLLKARPVVGYRSQKGIVAMIDNQTLEQDDDNQLPTVSVPIKVHDRVIGVIDARKAGGAWTAEQAAVVETLAEQLGVALESARLYQDTQRRAAQERLIGEVTSRMRESLDIETVLKTTASEVRQALDLDNLVIRLATPETDSAKPARERM
jgi:GAF domain-containing protein/HAMP domain-containing protein